MFLPFIPFIIALAGVTVIGSMSPAAAPAMEGWELALSLLSLPLLGAVLGNLSEARLGSRSPMRVSRRRIVLLAMWLAVLASTPIIEALGAFLRGVPAGEDLALGLLLGNYWVADALALHPYNPFILRHLAGQGRQLVRTMAVSLPIIVLVVLGMGLGVLQAALPELELLGGGVPPWLETLGMMATYLAVAGLLVPVLIPVCWGLKELELPETERVIREELAANGVSVARVLNWPHQVMGHATAGVIGIVPRFRYLLFADVLAAHLTPEEVRSVTAHEAGHIKHRHLWFLFVAILAFILFMHLLLQIVVLGGFLLDFSPPPWSLILLEVAALLLFLRFGIGFISRNFERQADGNALRRKGLASFEGAILKIARLNGMSTEADNWHHFGIARRIAYLRGAEDGGDFLARHDRTVSRIKAACLALLGLFLVAQTVISSTGVVPFVIESYWRNRGQIPGEASPAELRSLRFLASQAFAREDFPAAEGHFRRLLELLPGDPRVQNNLAWLLVTLPGADRARLGEGLQLAQQASRADAQAFIWDTLAEAYLRTSQFPQSASAARRALRLAEAGQGRGGTPLSYYRARFDAMTRFGEGEKGQ